MEIIIRIIKRGISVIGVSVSIAKGGRPLFPIYKIGAG